MAFEEIDAFDESEEMQEVAEPAEDEAEESSAEDQEAAEPDSEEAEDGRTEADAAFAEMRRAKEAAERELADLKAEQERQAALKAGFEKEEFEVAALVDDMDTMIRSVEAGLGVAIISEKVASSIGGRVRVAEIESFNEDRVFYMISLKSMSFSPAAEAFSGYVKSVIKDI